MTRFLERLLWKLYVNGVTSHLDRLCDRRWWWIVLHHEAGHAVARRIRFGNYGAIIAENSPNEHNANVKNGSMSFDKETIRSGRPLDAVIVLAAGAMAEHVLLNTVSDGFVVDASLIEKVSHPAVAESYYGIVPITVDDISAAAEEAASGFPITRELVTNHRSLIREIAEHAFRILEDRDLFSTPFDRFEILTTEDLELIEKRA